MKTTQLSPFCDGVTGVVLTCDGERLLNKCLDSLVFCDKILIVDSGSKDDTVNLAKALGATVIHRDWEGFASQFSFAQTRVTTRWFFILDQDEICPPSLGKIIKEAIAEEDAKKDDRTAYTAFSVGRKSWYFDRFLLHSGWYPDHILRVFRTGLVEFYQDAHVHYKPYGPSRHLGTPGAELIHYPYTGFFHHLAKINVYAQQGAEHMISNGKKGGIFKGIMHALWRFIRIYFIKRGFLDGKAGFLTAAHGSFYAFLKYSRTLQASWGEPFDNDSV